jgi:hypothetical protein
MADRGMGHRQLVGGPRDAAEPGSRFEGAKRSERWQASHHVIKSYMFRENISFEGVPKQSLFWTHGQGFLLPVM